MTIAAILPSRNEPSTITAVAAAVDTALTTPGGPGAVIIHADSSDTPDTATRFNATATQAAKVPLTGLTRGKGTQILTAAHHTDAHTRFRDADAVLIADTDTRNPDPGVYRALLDRVRDGAALAITDYPCYWDEANLTNHLARPLIAATTGIDVPQPLAGDLAVSHAALAAARRAAQALPDELAACVDGYGIDAFLLLTAAACGPISTVHIDSPKRHAGSFPHLPTIYRQAVPVLLHLTASSTPLRQQASSPQPPAPYRVTDRQIEPARLQSMLATLDRLGAGPDGYDDRPWPLPVADAWCDVASGTSAPEAARRLWPHYTRHVRDWLANGQHATTQQRAEQLASTHARLHAAVLTAAGARR